MTARLIRTDASTRPRGLEEQATATALYLMPADHRRLLVIDRGVSMQNLILDALNLLVAR